MNFTAVERPFARPGAGPTLADAGRFLEHGFVVLALLLYSQALLPTLLANDGDPDSSAFLRLLWLPVYALTLVFALARFGRFMSAARTGWLIGLCVALAVASALWAIEPGIALRRAFALLMTTAFGVYVAARYDWRDCIRLLAVIFAVLAVGSLVASVLTPGFGVHADDNAGAWRGLWFEKNTLGAEMARGALVFVCAAIFHPRRKWTWLLFAALAAALVIMSRSATSLLALIVIAATIAGVGLFRRGPATALVVTYLGALAAGVLALWLAIDPGEFLELIGKDQTLTGRTEIWSQVLAAIGERPWLGYGYQSFWHDPSGPAASVRDAAQWLVPSAHNGWLELALSLGWTGVGVFGAAFLAVLAQSVVRIGSGRESYFALAWSLTFLLFSISESSILERNSFSWVIFVIVAVKLFSGERASPARATAEPSVPAPPGH